MISESRKNSNSVLTVVNDLFTSAADMLQLRFVDGCGNECKDFTKGLENIKRTNVE